LNPKPQPLFSRIARKLSAVIAGRPTAEQEYEQRLLSEKGQFDDCLNVHDLPEIFHYWSNRYLVPMFEPFGFSSPNDFFFRYISDKCAASPDAMVRIASVGAGNCDLEIEIGKRLVDRGQQNFLFECLEINTNMIERANGQAGGSGLGAKFRFLEQDFNRWRPAAASYEVIMANQSLHHVLALEHLFDSIRLGLAKDGLFLTSDMIGRNGHQRWPEALAVVSRFWQELPGPYRYNQLMRRQERQYINHDCSTSGFEGIRAQDILALLLERFHFRLFLPYGNVVFVFVDRPFGHNFNAATEWDRAFIDRVHAADEQGFVDGTLKPTSMLAALTVSPGETKLRDTRLTPGFCVRVTDG